MAEHHPLFEPNPRTDRSTDRRLAFSVFAPPLAWFAHETIGVAVVGRHCAAADHLTGGQWTMLIASAAVAAAIAVTACVIAYRIFSRQAPAGRITEAEGWGRVEFISLLGMFVSVLLLLNIVYFALMPFVVNPCMRAI